MVKGIEKIVAALVSTPSLAEAAKQAGISEVTLWRRMQEPDVQAAYRAARRQLVEHSLAQVQSATSEAVETLRRNLTSASDAVQVRAAVAILDHAARGVELMDLEERIARIEEALAQRENARPGYKRAG